MKTHKAKTSLSELKPIQVSKWIRLIENFSEEKYSLLVENLNFRAQVVSIFLDISISHARRIDVNDLIDISDHYITLMSTFKHEDPKCKVTINGRNYVAQLSYGAWSTGQMIDVKILKDEDFYLHPERFLAIMYIEENMIYCQEDKYHNIINPNADRERIFAEHFPGDELWRWYAFFLRNYMNWSLAIMGIQTARMRIQKMKIEKEIQKSKREMKLRSGFYGQTLFTTCQKIWGKLRRK
jgi:hypothetical protein